MAEPYGLPPGTAINYRALGFPAWVDELCRQWQLDSSTYPGHQEGDRPDIGCAPNPAGLNRGIDWAGDPQRMLDFAHWLVSIGPSRTPGQYGPEGLEMVIYEHAPTGERVWYPDWVNYDADFSGHRDHVHTRQSASLIDFAAPPQTVMTVPLVDNGDGSWTSPSRAWAHLIMRESGGNPTIIQQIIDVNSGGNEAEGLFQITPATWRAHHGDQFAPTARLASPQEQAIVAARIFTANPSGSDWGAGLPGREDAAELATGLVAVTGAVVSPSEEEEDWMANPELERLLREVHAALFNQITSQSPYRHLEGEQGRWQLHELIKNDDQLIHQLYVENEARKGDPDAIALLYEIASADPVRYPDRQHDAALARKVLESLTVVSPPQQPPIVSPPNQPPPIQPPVPLPTSQGLSQTVAAMARALEEAVSKADTQIHQILRGSE